MVGDALVQEIRAAGSLLECIEYSRGEPMNIRGFFRPRFGADARFPPSRVFLVTQPRSPTTDSG